MARPRRSFAQERACFLHSIGTPIKDIAKKIGAARSNVYDWVRDVEVPDPVKPSADAIEGIRAEMVSRVESLLAGKRSGVTSPSERDTIVDELTRYIHMLRAPEKKAAGKKVA